MVYLAWQTLVWLIAAFIFGLFIGWLIWGKIVFGGSKQSETEIKKLKDELKRCRMDLDLCHAEVDVIWKSAKKPKLPASIPTAEASLADNLQEIIGVGPYLEGKLNAFGIYTFKQIAHLNRQNLRELGSTFGAFEERIFWDHWVDQAKDLHHMKYGEKI